MATPTVLLVHGAFADGSAWAQVIERLHEAGISAQALANPLRGLTVDGEYVASAAAQTAGPVLLVGHSYGGAVITYAGAKSANAAGLVYVAAFGIDTGESALGAVSNYPDPGLGVSIEPRTYPGSTEPEFYIKRELFHSAFAADLPESVTAIGAISQRPVSGTALGEPLSVRPAWKALPSWFAVATEDHAIHPDAQRMFAERMGAKTIEVNGSHSIAASQPDTVAGLIIEAVHAVADSHSNN
ncbi:alpha/beta fold hydrolase [Nocardia sp. NPDC056000]|uniref:alpha/beta fold hydrolase n=1 Tax=Nocardia sp. NPDC056000 TaxID=3345674 RepID=UPI0035DF16FC